MNNAVVKDRFYNPIEYNSIKAEIKIALVLLASRIMVIKSLLNARRVIQSQCFDKATLRRRYMLEILYWPLPALSDSHLKHAHLSNVNSSKRYARKEFAECQACDKWPEMLSEGRTF